MRPRSRASQSGSVRLPQSFGSGRSRVKVAPWPGTLAARMSPCISRTRSCTIARPSPLPPKRRLMELSACRNGEKMSPSAAASMPMPLSRTSISRRVAPPTSVARQRMLTLPFSVNLTALFTRLVTT
ncbi:MAG: hypothetical protein IPF74_02495 [Rhodocyclaceae bacterium]|nr:hypothetical protein [Rhodocyclaceae bacterium]